MNILPDTYFDLLPSEIILEIVPKLFTLPKDHPVDLEEYFTNKLRNFTKISYKIQKIFNKDSTRIYLIQKYLSEYYDVIQDEINIIKEFVKVDYLTLFSNVYMFHISDFMFIPKKYENIKYRYKIREEYPKFYELVKNFSLLEEGFFGKIPVYHNLETIDTAQRWKYLYNSLENFKYEQYISQDIKNFPITGDILSDYIYNSPESPIAYAGSYVSYIFYVLFLHPNFNMETQDEEVLYNMLHMAFMNNYDIYEELCKKISKNKLISIFDSDNGMRWIVEDILNNTQPGHEKYISSIKNMILDINEKIGL